MNALRTIFGDIQMHLVAIIDIALMTTVLNAAMTPHGQEQAAFFAGLQFPDSDPTQWQWSPSVSEKAIQLLGLHGTFHQHTPRAVIPINDNYPPTSFAGKTLEIGRGHGGMTYVNWVFGVQRMADFSMDITFHTVPKPKAAVYLQLYDYSIGKTAQYFGFQYSFRPNGKIDTKFIWSRWGTRDKADAWVAKGGTIESAGYEGDFVGIRYPYRWTKGTYTVYLMMRETDEIGTWYEMRIFSHQTKQWTIIGRLRFPGVNGEPPFISDGGGSWCEVFGGTETSKDIGLFHLSYGGVYTCGRTIVAKEARCFYGKDTPNSDIATDADGRRIHVIFGGDTWHIRPEGTRNLTAEPQ